MTKRTTKKSARTAATARKTRSPMRGSAPTGIPLTKPLFECGALTVNENPGNGLRFTMFLSQHGTTQVLTDIEVLELCQALQRHYMKPAGGS